MTKLPEGRNIFTQMLGSKGPRKFLATNVDRKLASNDAVNLWTATPEQRMKIQQEKANKKLLGYDTSSSNKNGVVSSGGVVGTITPLPLKIERRHGQYFKMPPRCRCLSSTEQTKRF